MTTSYKSRTGETGFTLIELLVALAVSGIIMSATGATLYQVWKNNTQNTTHMMAVKQIENALHFITRDVQMAQTIETSGLPTGEVLRLSWVSWESTSTSVVYSWNSVNHTLTRTKSDEGITTTVAYAVEQAPVFTPSPYTEDSQTLTVNITCTVQDVDETRVVDIVPRPGT
jgi:prepilin-type N-terminal cleavage/methylation domain-containing protein